MSTGIVRVATADGLSFQDYTVTLPDGQVVSAHDFAANGGTIGKMLTGSVVGPGRSFLSYTMDANSSTKAAAANALKAPQTNPYYFLRTNKAITNLQLSDFSVIGTPQGHWYGGLMVDHCDGARLSRLLFRGIPGGGWSPPPETFGVNGFGGANCVYDDIEVDGAGVTASGIGMNDAVNITWINCFIHDCPYGMPTFWQTNGLTTHDLRSYNNHIGVNHERVSGPVRHYGLALEVPGVYGQMHLTFNNDQADNPDAEFHFDHWTGGSYGNGGPLCVMIGDAYQKVDVRDSNGNLISRTYKQKQKTLPKMWAADGTLMRWADAGSAGDPTWGLPATPSSNVAAAKADPTHWAVRFH
jgi:hypothetical protein